MATGVTCNAVWCDDAYLNRKMLEEGKHYAPLQGRLTSSTGLKGLNLAPETAMIGIMSFVHHDGVYFKEANSPEGSRVVQSL
jgi:hypothetical protein